MSFCLLAGTLSISLATTGLTLAWNHSVERQVWEEDWRLENGQLVLDAARIRGSGAGMEAGDGAVLKDGAWQWHPNMPPQKEIVLRRSGATADYRVCIRGDCRPLSALLPPEADPVTLRACP
ncbi:MAG TPA: DUF1850 domain-containing protein [Rhabdaerophilum sp.]|nr:DUF1850 domain-containing protein [Rhabdaerophilum sp.]